MPHLLRIAAVCSGKSSGPQSSSSKSPPERAISRVSGRGMPTCSMGQSHRASWQLSHTVVVLFFLYIGTYNLYLYKRLIYVFVGLVVARTTVHVQRTHSVVVRTYKRLKGRFILHFFAMRRPATDLRRRKYVANLHKTHFAMCVCWFENTFKASFEV